MRSVPLCLVLIAALAGDSFGQSTEYRLGDSREWTSAGPPPAGSDAALIADARRHLAEDHPDQAKTLLDPWIEANARSSGPYVAEALLLRGDALVALDREFSALYDYEAICQKHRESDAFTDAVQRELEIAVRYAQGLRIRILGIRWGDPEDVMVELFLRVIERLPKSQAAERAMIELADYYYRRRELVQAKEVYDAYIESFPNGPNSLRARERRIHCDVARFKGPRYNAAPLIDAAVQVEQFGRRYPAEAEATGINAGLAARLDESQAAQLLDTGNWYLNVGDEPSARFVFKRLLRDHPLTLSAERAEAIMRQRGWESAPAPAADTEAAAASDLDPSASPTDARRPESTGAQP